METDGGTLTGIRVPLFAALALLLAAILATTAHASATLGGCATTGPQPLKQDGATVTATFDVRTGPCSVTLTATVGGTVAASASGSYQPGSYTLTVAVTCGQTNAIRLDLGGAAALGMGATCAVPPAVPPVVVPPTVPPPTTPTVAEPTVAVAATPTQAEVPTATPTTVAAIEATTQPSIDSASAEALADAEAAGSDAAEAALAARSAALNVLYAIA